MLRVWAQTDVGCVRTNNEDAYWEGGDAGWHLAVVADGMGGHQAGEVASRVAVEVVGRLVQAADPAGKSPAACQQLLSTAVARANEKVYALARQEPAFAGMGTTLTAALIHGSALELAHVGDSRAYRLRAGRLELLTEDHSLVQELVNKGTLSPAEARFHPQRHILTRALGTEPELKVDLKHQETLPGDVLLLCTDGLSGVLEDAELEEVLNRVPRREVTAELVHRANSKGGRDNITVVVVEVGALQ
ncbi:MAG TPA: Stp1/IreP family PP2C-type Ser/Thr phosphatase [Firmicutes bacterium]|nr:Stp1/IreP family PP2C-type Ser/Thr phosphatase [Bacillota bacterium]